ncbi:T-box transcription factor TBX15-like [Mizuhopecten yessoensis]|uniref:T-box transcription factor TBX15 n=1 Tax=Mizuhopecten yessoensis TaxID=6573 RepID=A0A210Q2N2_MIZYE|nr:T-box transcription factor TBX15-like [Mizuhopecten yessoensis]OWF43000.1 T-box transcription factor TBX15 [Mizuhopecten yessoensis]
MLSPNAEAFQIENLLGLKTTERTGEETCTASENTVRNICLSSAASGGIQCIHPARQTVHETSNRGQISVELCHSDLWHAFHNLGTEMIITKTGRRMFPAIRVRIQGLESKKRYKVYLDFQQQDKHKYRYVYHSSKWMVSGSGETMVPNQVHHHPDSPLDSSHLTSQVVSFERIKLTNSDKMRAGQISLVSMQKFIPRIHVESVTLDQTPGEPEKEHFVAIFPQTSFIAVTAYQNQEITRLKIARNPFAKGFREAGKNRSSLEAMMESYGLHVDGSGSFDMNSLLGRRVLKRSAHQRGDTNTSECEGEYMKSILYPYTYIQRPIPVLTMDPSLNLPGYIKVEAPDIYSSDAYSNSCQQTDEPYAFHPDTFKQQRLEQWKTCVSS